MPYGRDGNDKIGYNIDGDERIAKLNRLSEYYDEQGNKNRNYGHEVYDLGTGVIHYNGPYADKSEGRRAMDDEKMKHLEKTY